MKARAFAFAVIAVLACAGAAHAEPALCPRGGEPWLRLSTVKGFDTKLVERVASLLAADLSAGVAVCVAAPPNGAPPPLADVELSMQPADTLTIAVANRATNKRLSRDVALAGIPGDAWDVAIAEAADGLLRASWLEALLNRSSRREEVTAPPPPPVVKQVAERSLRAPAPPPSLRAMLAVLAAGEHATGGQTLGGFDARFGFGGRLAVGARVGYRLGVVAAADHGDVESSVFLGGLSVSYAPVSRQAPWSVEVFARANLARVSFSGVAASGATAASGSALGALAGGGIGASRALGGGLRLVAEVSLAAPLRAVAAVDDGREVTALSGASLGVGLGVAAGL